MTIKLPMSDDELEQHFREFLPTTGVSPEDVEQHIADYKERIKSREKKFEKEAHISNEFYNRSYNI